LGCKTTAGLLLYRRRDDIEVLLVHPGGPLWSRKDAGAWSLPKGQCDAGEDSLEAAKREFLEETGTAVDGDFVALSPVMQRSGKTVCAWAIEADFDPSQLKSNSFSMEWPPRSGRVGEFPEVDRAAWFDLPEARKRILGGQVSFIDQLDQLLKTSDATGTPAIPKTNQRRNGSWMDPQGFDP
jgi:predicted NUDIX family NTP pyrophosphohydrolase